MARSGQYQRELRESQAQHRALRDTHSQLAVEHARMLVTVCKPLATTSHDVSQSVTATPCAICCCCCWIVNACV